VLESLFASAHTISESFFVTTNILGEEFLEESS